MISSTYRNTIIRKISLKFYNFVAFEVFRDFLLLHVDHLQFFLNLLDLFGPIFSVPFLNNFHSFHNFFYRRVFLSKMEPSPDLLNIGRSLKCINLEKIIL